METEFEKTVRSYLSVSIPDNERAEGLYRLVSCFFVEAMMKQSLSVKQIIPGDGADIECRVIRFIIEGKVFFWISYLEQNLVSHVYLESLENGMISNLYASYDINVPHLSYLLNMKLLEKKWVVG